MRRIKISMSHNYLNITTTTGSTNTLKYPSSTHTIMGAGATKKKTFEEKVRDKLFPQDVWAFGASGMIYSSNVSGTYATLNLGSSGLHNCTISTSGILQMTSTNTT